MYVMPDGRNAAAAAAVHTDTFVRMNINIGHLSEQIS